MRPKNIGSGILRFCFSIFLLIFTDLSFGSYPAVLQDPFVQKTYYIDSNNGNDQNTGSSPAQAWKTLDMINTMVFGPGDSILFKKGGIWTGVLSPNGTGTYEKKIVFSSYGEGSEKPLIHANGNDQAVILKNMEHLIFEGFRITNPSTTTERRARGIYIYADQAQVFHDITIRNNEIYQIIGWVRQNRRYSSGAIFMDTNGDQPRFENLLIENNYIHDVTTRGITGNAGATNWTDTAYQHKNIIIRNNFIDNTGCDAIRTIASRDVLVEHNTIYRTGNYTMGEEALYIAACFPQQCGNTTWQYNEIAYTATTSPTSGDMDSQAFDVDHDCSGLHTFQYNYTHDNAGGAFLIMGESIVNPEMGPLEGIIIRYNISQNDGIDFPRIFELHDFKGETLNIRVYNNIFYYTSGTMAVQLRGTSFNGIDFSNNIFYAPQGSYPAAVQMDNNLYYPHNPAIHDQQAINLDPMFADPGKGTEGMNTLDGYKILSASPVTGAGVIFSGNGGKDFWGNPLPDSAHPDIGAFQINKSTGINEKTHKSQDLDMSLFPNPFTQDITIQYAIRESGKVSIRIYNNSGEQVKTLYERNSPPGSFSIMWNGEDNMGKKVAPGTFFLYLGMDYSFRMAKIICI